MSAGTINQDDIKFLEAQEELKLVEDPKIITLLEDTAKKVKGMIFQELTSRHGTTKKKKKKSSVEHLPENALFPVMDIKQILDNPNLNGTKQEVIKEIDNVLATVHDDVKKLVEIVLGSSLKTEIKK